MPDPIECVFILIVLFSLLLATSFFISIAFAVKNGNKFQENDAEDELKNTANVSKIYYVERYKKSPTAKRKKRKKAQIALKGTIIGADKLEKITQNESL